MFKTKLSLVLKETTEVLNKIDEKQVAVLIDAILEANKVVTVGAGRMGMASNAFAMRLSHMKFNSYNLGDSNLPGIGEKDLLVVSSGSGETQTIYDLVLIAKLNKVKIGLITNNPGSRMGKLADFILEFHTASKMSNNSVRKSLQPMTTLNEQSLWLFFDALTLLIMDKKGITGAQMLENHSILE